MVSPLLLKIVATDFNLRVDRLHCKFVVYVWCVISDISFISPYLSNIDIKKNAHTFIRLNTEESMSIISFCIFSCSDEIPNQD